MTLSIKTYLATETEWQVITSPHPGLTPGVVLSVQDRFYGRVLSVKFSQRRAACFVKVQPISGPIPTEADEAMVLSESDKVTLAQQAVLTSADRLTLPTVPFALVADRHRLGALTVLETPDAARIAPWLPAWCQLLSPRSLIIDPLGLLPDTLKAGADARLAIDAIGLPRFLDLLVSDLPPLLQAEPLALLAQHAPTTPGFVPFHHFLTLEGHALLHHLLVQVYHQRVFADDPAHTLAFTQAHTVLNLTGLHAPWQALFYETALKQFSGGLTCLIAPPPGVFDPVAGSGQTLIVTDSAAHWPTASNVIRHVDGRWQLTGTLTAGFPLWVDLSEVAPPPSNTFHVPAAPAPDPPPPPALPVDVAPEAISLPPVAALSVLPEPPLPVAEAPPLAPDLPVWDTEMTQALDDIFGNNPDFARPPSHDNDDDFHFVLPGDTPLDTLPTATVATIEAPPSGPTTAQDVPYATTLSAPSVDPFLDDEPALFRHAEPAFQVGDAVLHDKYGHGVVKKVIFTEETGTVLNIHFDSVGKRLLDPERAPLRPA